MELQQISRSAVELIIRKLLNYQEYFDKNTGIALRNFIRYLYDLGEAEVQKAKVYHLYQKITDLAFQLSSQKYKANIFQKAKEKW